MTRSRHLRSLVVPLAGLLAAACADKTSTLTSPSSPAESRAAAGSSRNVPPTVAAAPIGNARFSRLNAVDVAVSPRAAAAVLAVSGAAPGDLVRTFDAANPAGCGIQTGIAFDGTNLIMSCYSNNKLDLLSSTDGHLIKTLTIEGLGSFGALAWDGRQNRLYACHNTNQVYLIDTSDPDGDGVITPAEYAFKFTAGGCFDGLAFDGADNTLWSSADASYPIYHYKPDGTQLAAYSTNVTGGYGNSGIAAGGGKLYLANNGGSQIWVADKPPTTSTLFATFPRRIEDLECDDITFRNEGIATIWQQDAYDRQIQAYAIEPGACPFGGAVVPQTVMDVQPGRLSTASSPVANVILISNGLFNAATANPANIRFVVNNNTAGAASVAKRGANYVTSTADWNHDGRLDRMVVFSMAALRAAGLTAGSTVLRVEDVASATNKFQASDTVLPTILP